MIKKLLIVFSVFFSLAAVGQVIRVDTANAMTLSLCKGQLTSSIPGLFVTDPSGGYNDNEQDTLTLCSGSGSPIRVNFYWVSLEANFDILDIYDGPNTSSPLLATVTGISLYPGVYTSTGTCLTFVFSSDAATNNAGFNALIGCEPTQCNSNPLPSDSCSTAPTICNLDGYCGNTSGWFTRDNGQIEQSPSGNDVFSCGTIQNNSWFAFVASDDTAKFLITSSQCSFNLGGIQAIVLSSSDCANFTGMSNCLTQGVPGADSLIATGLTIGQKYYIMVDGVNGNDCRYDINAIKGVDTASVTASVNPLCPGANQTLTAYAPGSGLTYNWSPAPLSGQGTATAVYDIIGSTTYSCTINGACGASETPDITSSPQISLVVSNDTVCLGDSIHLQVAGASSYVWSDGTLTDTLNYESTAAGTTTYTVTATDAGCSLDTVVVAVVNAVPSFMTPTLTNATCSLSNGSLEANVMGGTMPYSYSWQDTTILAVVGTDSAITAVLPGAYQVTVSDSYNCSIDTVYSIIDTASVQLQFGATPLTGTIPLTVSFTNSTTGATNYNWNFGNGQSDTAIVPASQVYVVAGTYSVTLLANNAICADSATVIIIAEDSFYVDTIPNIFTPNDDGINDVFEFSVHDGTVEVFQIFNRWGVKIYEKPQLEGLSTLIWDGHTTSGEPCSDGTYFYALKVSDSSGNIIEKKGFILLIR